MFIVGNCKPSQPIVNFCEANTIQFIRLLGIQIYVFDKNICFVVHILSYLLKHKASAENACTTIFK